MKTLTCKKGPAQHKNEAERAGNRIMLSNSAKPLREKVFLNHRSPWRRYYYAKKGRARNGMAAMAIGGMGRGRHLEKWKALPECSRKEHRFFSFGVKTKEKGPHGKRADGSGTGALIETPKAPAVANLRNAAAIAENGWRGSTGRPEAGTAKDADCAVPAARNALGPDRTGGNRSPLPAPSRVATASEAKLSFIETPGVRVGGGCMGPIAPVEAHRPKPNKHQMPMIRTVAEALFGAFRPMPAKHQMPTIRTVAEALFGAFRPMPATSQGRPQENSLRTAPQAIWSKDERLKEPAQTAKQTSQQPARAPQPKTLHSESKTQNPKPKTWKPEHRTHDPKPTRYVRPERMRKGSGYLSSAQKKIVQLKTTQGAADLPE